MGCRDELEQPHPPMHDVFPQCHVKLELMEMVLAVLRDSFWAAELVTSQTCSVPAVCPSLPCRTESCWHLCQDAPPQLSAGAPPRPVTTVTLGKLRHARKGRDLPLCPRSGTLHLTPFPHPRKCAPCPDPPDTLGSLGDFNGCLFSCRGPWCYPGRGGPRSRFFPR